MNAHEGSATLKDAFGHDSRKTRMVSGTLKMVKSNKSTSVPIVFPVPTTLEPTALTIFLPDQIKGLPCNVRQLRSTRRQKAQRVM